MRRLRSHEEVAATAEKKNGGMIDGVGGRWPEELYGGREGKGWLGTTSFLGLMWAPCGWGVLLSMT